MKILKNVNLLLKFIIISIILIIPFKSAFSQSLATNYFVDAQKGNDANNGLSVEKPFKTISKAKDAVRFLDKSGSNNITVNLRGGTYFQDQTLEFTEKDGGTENCKIIYRNYKDEVPIISGGRQITGWQKDKGGLWVAKVPWASAGSVTPSQLFVNGRRSVPARMPNEGKYFRLAVRLPAEQSRTNSFYFREGDLKKWANINIEDASVVLMQHWDAPSYHITSIDTGNRLVTFDPPSKWQINNCERASRYYVMNILEGLDTPGEWYINRKTGLLYYYPLPGEDMNSAEAIAPLDIPTVVRLKGDSKNDRYVKYIRFSGISFQHSHARIYVNSWQAESNTEAAITAEWTRNCAFVDCEIAHIGEYGIWLKAGCEDNLISRCNIHDLGAGGVRIGLHTAIAENTIIDPSGEWGGHVPNETPKEILQPALRNTIDNNFIHDGGHIFAGGIGVLVARSSYNMITHNEVCDFNYTGISVGWEWGFAPTAAHHNIISHNHIHHLNRGMFSDGGGIYTLGVSPGTEITYNLIHDLWGYPINGFQGIYLDEGTSGILVENNIVYRVTTFGCFLHYGEENVVRNNIFAEIENCGIGFADSPNDRRLVPSVHISNNIISCKQPFVLGEGGFLKGKFVSDRNVFYCSSGKPDFEGMDFQTWQAKGNDKESLVADPGFEDMQKHDFRLKPGAAALKLGFRQIETKDIGLYGDADWVALPKQISRPEVDFTKLLVSAKRKLSDTPIGENDYGVLPVPLSSTEPLAFQFKFDSKKIRYVRYYSGSEGNIKVCRVSSVSGKPFFNGDDSFIEIPYSEKFNIKSRITLAAWINTAAGSLPNSRIICKPTVLNDLLSMANPGGDNDYPYNMYALMLGNSNVLRIELASGGKQYSLDGKKQIPLDSWTHVVATYDGSAMKLYINGEPDNSIPFTGSIDTNSEPLYIGCQRPMSSAFLGAIDGVRVYDKALTAEEIKVLAKTRD